jgi:hypothetical protein
MKVENDPVFDRIFGALRWIARIAALALTGMLVHRVLARPASALPLPGTPGVVTAAVVAALTGLLIAWFWEGPGAAFILAAFLLFAIANQGMPVNVIFMAVLLTGVLFLFSWLRGRLLRHVPPPRNGTSSEH